MSTPPLSIVILAAGRGKRMHSDLPKVLQPLGAEPLLAHVVRTARALDPARIVVVYGRGGDRVSEAIADDGLAWVEQREQLGTGHALAQALPELSDADLALVLYGDVPLIEPATLRGLIDGTEPQGIGLLTMVLDNPAGYGRIVRDAGGAVERIVEDKDAGAAERVIQEVNTGILAAPVQRLRGWLPGLDNDNLQGEFYLTDVIGLAVREGVPVHAAMVPSAIEVMGVNDKKQLATLEREHQRKNAEALMAQGVTLRDPARFDLRGELRAGRDVEIDVNVIVEGSVRLGDRVRVGPNTLLRDCEIGDDTEVLSHCVIEDAVIGRRCRVGPFSRIRPGTRIAEDAHIGNFVEVKKSQVGDGSKVNHLSYIGDTTIGRRVNVGAGTITCNYDGANKHQTVIEDDAFIGSDTQLVAPVKVGAGATIGAGSTITRDTPPGELTLSRAEQKTRPGWKRPAKKK